MCSGILQRASIGKIEAVVSFELRDAPALHCGDVGEAADDEAEAVTTVKQSDAEFRRGLGSNYGAWHDASGCTSRPRFSAPNPIISTALRPNHLQRDRKTRSELFQVSISRISATIPL
jgi:hypothetical protein